MGNNYISSHIGSYNNNSEYYEKEKIIFRIVNLNDTYFFAEEIVTKCIFPIFNCVLLKDKENAKKINFSYVKSSKYEIFYPLIGDNNLKFKLDLEDEDIKDLVKPSFLTVKKYILEKNNDKLWQNKIKRLEQENEYMCDLEVIKEKIKLLSEDKIEVSEQEKNDIKYETYIPKIDTKDIEEFGYDLSTQKDLCHLVGREDEIKKIIKTICIREKSVLLIGESGSGKTSIVEKMALDIKNRSNSWLNDKLIFSLNLSNVVADSEFSGQFEKKMNKIIDFCKQYQGRLILFIDEIHNLYGLGRTKNSSIDGMNILKPYISNGMITVIGATTKEEYEKYMFNDPAFVRRFDLVNVSLPDNEMNLNILLSYITQLENLYKIKFNFNDYEREIICNYIIEITDPKNQRVVGDIKVNNPTLAKNIIEDAFAESVYKRKKLVDLEEICFSILSCDKLSITFRKDKVNELKNIVIKNINEENNNVFKLVKVNI